MKRTVNSESGEDKRPGARLANVLKEKGMMQKDLAEGIGWSPQQINYVINGSRKMSEELLQTIVKYFDEERPEYYYLPATEQVHIDDMEDEKEKRRALAGKIERAFDKEAYPGHEYDVFEIERGTIPIKLFLNPDYLLGNSDEMYIPETEVTVDDDTIEHRGLVLMRAICDVLRLDGYDIRFTGMPYAFLSTPDFSSELAQKAEKESSFQATIKKGEKTVSLTPSELYGLFWRYVRAMRTITGDMIYEKKTAEHFK